MMKKHDMLTRMILPRCALLVGIFSLALLAGCGEKQELTTFKEEMNTFYDEIISIEESMDAIDPSAEDATTSLLEDLARMDEEFQFLAQIEVPQEFISVEDLADDAASYMTEAVSLYNQLYSADTYNEATAVAASENYNRAMKRVNYIASLLQGELPEDDSLEITETEGNE
jgi:hypothetical protein